MVNELAITAHVRGKHHKDMAMKLALPGWLHHFLDHKFHRV